MRLVAAFALVALVTLPMLVSAGSFPDDCAAAGPTGCAQVSTPREASPPAAPATYYLYAKAATCAPSFDAVCSGRPADNAPVGFLGTVYQESNNVPGLQRFSFVGSNGVRIPADKAVLI